MPNAFESGLMWTVYLDMEKRFLNFLDYVPFTYHHRKVYSHKLLQLMLQIGGYVDTSFKEMATYSSFANNGKCEAIKKKAARGELVSINLAREAFEPLYDLSSKFVNVKSPEYVGRVIVERWRPFAEFKYGKSPAWWKAYNEVKHDWLANFEKANVSNSLNALASAFLLNVIHKPSILILARSGVVKNRFEQEIVSEELLRKMMEGKHPRKDIRPTVETTLFFSIVSPKAK